MYLQRVIAWAVLLVLAGLTVFGLLNNGVFRQNLWEPAGLQRLLIFAGLYTVISAAAIWLIPRWYLPLVAALTFVYTGLAVGFVAPVAIGYLAISCWAMGAIWFRSQPQFLTKNLQLPVFVGLASWVFFVMATSRWPIHYRWIYWLLPALPIAYALRRRLLPDFQLEYAKTRRDLAPLAAALFPLFCAWLAALKPEVSADGLAMHMVIPARMASAHFWAFDVHEFIWAVMPMGGDWAFTFAWMLGGEPAARLLNCAILALIAWTLYERLHARVPGWMCAALVGGFLSTPLTQQVTGSLFVENFVAAMLFGSILLLRIHLKDRRSVYFLACAFLAGMAAASKLGAWAYIAPLFVIVVFLVKPQHLSRAAPLLIIVGGFPYWEAWLRTQNPFFPMFNAWFRSPYFHQAANFTNPRYLTRLSTTTWYDITFHSRRFIEGLDGSMGVFFFVLVPLCIVGWRQRWPRTGKILLGVSIVGCILTYLGQSYLRYLYPALPMFTLLGGIAVASFRLHHEWTGRAIAAAAAVTFLVNLALLPAAGYYHRGFALNQVLDPASVDRYLLEMAPERKLVNWLNANDPQARVAWLEGNAVADFHGHSLTNSWHSEPFYTQMAEAQSADSIDWLAQSQKIAYFIAPAAGSWRAVSNVHARRFMETFTLPVTEAGGIELRRWTPAGGNGAKRAQPYAGLGQHDEYNQYVTFEGHWTRDLQFQGALRSTLVYTNDPKSSLKVHFRGAAVRLIYTSAANRCEGRISIDQGEPLRLNQYSDVTHWQQISAPFRAAEAGEHTLQMVFPPPGARGQIAGCYLDLDGFVVE
ncbi:MAG: hypothetical protein IPP47_28825 [Bryobacterales bacterium]|nr:hypothetical protein [Bryobacterales bacterium]